MLLKNTYVVKNSVKTESGIVFVARKRYTVAVNAISGICCALNS